MTLTKGSVGQSIAPQDQLCVVVGNHTNNPAEVEPIYLDGDGCIAVPQLRRFLWQWN